MHKFYVTLLMEILKYSLIFMAKKRVSNDKQEINWNSKWLVEKRVFYTLKRQRLSRRSKNIIWISARQIASASL